MMNKTYTELTSRLPLQIIFLALVMSLIGCAGQDKPASSGQEKMDAARVLLAEAAYVKTLFSECEKLGNDIELETVSVQQDWLIKNRALILAADNYYSEQEKPSGVLYQGELLSLAAIKLAYDAQQRAKKDLNFSQRSPINRQKVCLNRLKTLADNEMDLSKKINGNSPLFADSQSATTGNIGLGSVPSMAGTAFADKDPGRTHYNLTEQLKQECAQTELLVLRSDWPNETYAVYCNNNPVTLMVCEWGKCEQRAN